MAAYTEVDATTLDKGDQIRASNMAIVTVEKVYRREGKPFRVKFIGYAEQTIKPGRMVELISRAKA